MWSSLPRTLATARLVASGSAANRTARRHFLSAAFRDPQAWNGRLQTPILQRCKPESFYYELDAKFAQQGKCSAIDVDIFANRLTDAAFSDEVADLMHKLRLTEETANTLPSTSHAVCRVLLEHNADIHDLLAILDDRISYGVFLDSFTASLALDRLIRERDFTAAARIATFLMLQEDFDAPIARQLALFACCKYLQAPASFDRPVVEDAAAAADPVLAAAAAAEAAPAKGAAAKKKKQEEVRVRVNFIRNEYFDDHFDLREPQRLVGKTLAMIGRRLLAEGGDGQQVAVGNSAMLLGLWHHGKVADAAVLVQKLAAGKAVIHADVVRQVAELVAAVEEKTAEVQQLAEGLTQLGAAQTVAEDFEKAVCGLANEAVERNEATDIEAQAKIYADWCSNRQTQLEAELQRLERAARLREIERRTADMEREEQKLWFFENEDQIDLQIDSKQVRYAKRWFGKKKKPRVVDAGYVPPEIVRKTKGM